MKAVQKKYFTIFALFALFLILIPILAYADNEEETNPKMVALGLAFLLIFFIFIAISIACFILHIILLVDCAKRNFGKKLKWLLIIMLVPFGWVFYYFIIKKPNIISNEKQPEKVESMANASFIVGAIALFFVWFGVIAGITAIILGIIARKRISPDNNGNKSKENSTGGKELATAGIVLGIVSIVLQILIIVFYIAVMLIVLKDSPLNDFKNKDIPRLEMDYLVIGKEQKEYCLENKERVFYKTDVLCAMPVNATGFTKKNDLNWIDMDFKIIDSTGKTVQYRRNLFGDDGELFLFDNTLNGYFVMESLKPYDYGNYTFSLTIRDVYNNNQLNSNRTISIISRPNDELVINNFNLGVYRNGGCYFVNGITFSQKDVICLQPFVKGLEKYQDGKYLFDMDIRIKDKADNIIDYQKGLFSGKGTSEYSTLYKTFVSKELNIFPPEAYFIEATVYDLSSNKKGNVKARFIVSDDDGGNAEEILLPSALMDAIPEGRVKSYTLYGIDYEIEVDRITRNPASASFIVNGVETGDLREGSSYVLPDGAILRIDTIIENETDDSESKDMAAIYLSRFE